MMLMSRGRKGGGGTLIFFIHILGLFFGVQNFELQYFWGLFSGNHHMV